MVQFHPALDPLLVSMEEVSSHPANPRNGDVEAIAESIQINGFVAPVIAQKSTGHIIAGNHRYYALMSLGSGVIPVIWVDIDDTAAKRYLLADNRTSDMGTYDHHVLIQLLEELQAEDLTLLGTGYRDYDLEALKALAEIDNEGLGDVMSWPTLTFTVPPHVKNAFKRLTSHAGDDREAFEMMLRLAGWDGKK
jgi:ParB-like chromosome segregation protein Spo0J